MLASYMKQSLVIFVFERDMFIFGSKFPFLTECDGFVYRTARLFGCESLFTDI